MEKIEAIFKKDIKRKIEEVIKVEQHDEKTVRDELQEYVTTEAIKEHFYRVYDEVAKYPSDPHEGIGIWVSGFFGSGKSSFAKILGYTLSNRKVLDKTASVWFRENIQDEKMTSYLQNINSRFPLHAIIFDVSMDRGVRTTGERITEIMYKALLRDLGYSEDFDLAELEITLEHKGKLEAFISLFNKRFPPWQEERDMAMGIVEASNILHEMMPDILTTPDSWSNALGAGGNSEKFTGRADITPNKLAERTFDLIKKRKPGYGVIFVIDEVGQYVSRSVDKMLDLQAIIQAFGIESKKRFKAKEITSPCWIIVTSQEKLNEVLDSLDEKKVELSRLQDRFSITIDLKSSDIQEVTSKRVLQKNEKGIKILNDLFVTSEGRLKTHSSLERTNRDIPLHKEEFINLYPYLPYQIDLCIDIVAGFRMKRGSQKHVGGSNRTIIKQAQQMLIHPRTNLSLEEVGTLVTLDKVYELLYTGNLLPTEITREVDDINKYIPEDDMALKVAKSIALLESVRNLPRTRHNIAVSLHPSVSSDSILKEVERAISLLEKDQIIRETEEGYKLLTVQEKNWDTTRSGLAPKPKQRNEIKQNIIDEILNSPRTRAYSYKKLSTFRIGLFVNNVKKQDGKIVFSVNIEDEQEHFDEKKNEIRVISREESHKNEIFWVFSLIEDIHKLIDELYRSRDMVATYSILRSQNQITPEETTCLEDEKQRENRIYQKLKSRMGKAFEAGSGIFRGVVKDGSALGNTLVDMVTGMFDIAIPDIYPKLEMGSGKIKGKEVDTFFASTNLEELPDIFYNSGFNLVVKQNNKYIPNINADTAKEVMDYIRKEHSYGTVTGEIIEDHFQDSPYGWGIDILRLILAVLFRSGSIEVTFDGARHKNYLEVTSREPFTNSNAFRKSLFSPREAIDLTILLKAGQNYTKITGHDIEYDEVAIASAFRKLAEEDKDVLIPLCIKGQALNLPLKNIFDDFRKTVEKILISPDDDCVLELASHGMDYKKDREKIRKIANKLSDKNIEIINKGKFILSHTIPLIDKLGYYNKISCKAEELKVIFSSDDFYDKLDTIRLNSEDIKSCFYEIYEAKHNERQAVFEKTINLVKNHNNFLSLSNEEQENILKPFETRRCSNISITDRNYCNNCQATIEQIDSDLLAVSGMKKEAFHKIEKLTLPQVKIKHIRVSDFISGYLEKPQDIDSVLEKMRKQLLELIGEGYKISLE
ncbi:MAG: BREX system P-loop protein BrxC [Candidatus Eremiobacterota bacterium]